MGEKTVDGGVILLECMGQILACFSEGKGRRMDSFPDAVRSNHIARGLKNRQRAGLFPHALILVTEP
ncbi:hypothetical protein [Desulfopila sp. IMCC35006]|uniref:hypothetical protein n=1 Tax=Desulfopila sp. IMCC35006 TaxID=2569542 RepID=UPI0012946C2E|nr:hypothetical protein [Desulfopila sp. IMCC35006]